jgi:hypothetical protein
LTPENGEVVGQDAQTDFASLTATISSPKGGSHVSLEHAKDRFNLPALAALLLGKALFYQAPIMSCHGTRFAVIARTTSVGGWDDTANPQFVATETVKSFGPIARIARKGFIPIPEFIPGIYAAKNVHFSRRTRYSIRKETQRYSRARKCYMGNPR